MFGVYGKVFSSSITYPNFRSICFWSTFNFFAYDHSIGAQHQRKRGDSWYATAEEVICRNASRGGQLQQRWCGSSYATAEEAIFRNPWRGGQLYWRDSHSWDTSVEKAICRNPIWRENLIYLLLCYSLWNYKVIYRNKFIYSFIARQKTFLPGGSEHPE